MVNIGELSDLWQPFEVESETIGKIKTEGTVSEAMDAQGLPVKDKRNKIKKNLVVDMEINGKVKGMRINRTSQKSIANRYGADTKGWINKDFLIRKVTYQIGDREEIGFKVEPYIAGKKSGV